ncbi:GTP:AMP phosphotransferase ak3, mitochondrial [Dermatophagoides farinae]|uniref:GTP:AMP phosphotransferase ak3, mitochondrial n=1 Tax=Dermatophagoides farinae TaxID=6954 RepID=A0A922HUH6_DERFA|nr:GTP:AMP phosphotransferase ak3, mitochondrial [Dermatophagoides farinae]
MATKFFLKLVILGAPGSGKGTISNRMIRDFKLTYFAVGDCLRDHMKQQTEIGKEAKRYIEQGKLVPDSTINQLVINELREHGYPRNREQTLELWRQPDEFRPNAVINLIVPDDEIIERIKHRWVHLPSGRIYHMIYSPPKNPGVDDETGEPLTQRNDDKPDVIKARLHEFHKQNDEIVKLFREKKIVHDFEGRESDIIYPKIKTFLEQFIRSNTAASAA